MTSVNLSTQQLIKDKASNGFIVELMEMCLHVQRVYHLSSLVWPDRTFCMYYGCTQNAYFSPLVERVFLRVRVFIAGISRHVESLILVLLR